MIARTALIIRKRQADAKKRDKERKSAEKKRVKERKNALEKRRLNQSKKTSQKFVRGGYRKRSQRRSQKRQ